MNRKLLFIETILVAIMTFTGCSSKTENLKSQIPQTKAEVSGKCIIKGNEAPEWVCSGGNIKGYLTAVGYAKSNPLGFSFQKTEAMALARDTLIREISVKIKNMVKTYMGSTGVNNETSDKVIEQVSKQIAYMTLNGSKQLNIYVDKNNDMYVLAGVPVQNIKQAIQTSFKNNKSLWQKFEAKQIQEELNKEVEKEFN